MLAQVGEQHAEIHAGATQPLFKHFAAGLVFAGQLAEVEERAVGTQDSTVQIGDSQRVGCAFHHLQQLALAGRQAGLGHVHRACEAQQEVQVVFLPELRGRHHHVLVGIDQADGARLGAPAGAKPVKRFPHGSLAGHIEAAEEGPARQA